MEQCNTMDGEWVDGWKGWARGKARKRNRVHAYTIGTRINALTGAGGDVRVTTEGQEARLNTSQITFGSSALSSPLFLSLSRSLSLSFSFALASPRPRFVLFLVVVLSFLRRVSNVVYRVNREPSPPHSLPRAVVIDREGYHCWYVVSNFWRDARLIVA